MLTFLLAWIAVSVIVDVASGAYVAAYSMKRHIPDEIDNQIAYVSRERVCDLMVPYFIRHMPFNAKIIFGPFIMMLYILLIPIMEIITVIYAINEIDNYCQFEKAG